MGKLDPKSSGGGGFDFEDKVGAYFLSFLLSGQRVFPTLQRGKLVSVKLQRKVDGWEFDDFVLEFESEDLTRYIALSIKSNSQITAKKAPADLVSSAWSQFCKTEKNPFRSKHDYIGIITSGASQAAIETYGALQDFSKKHKGADLAIHLQQPGFTNQDVRDLFASFAKPTTILDTKLQPSEIIERLLHFDFNLDDPASSHLNVAFQNLSSALETGSAETLWEKLQHLVKTSRSAAGSISYDTLVEALGSDFVIKGHRSLESDLKALRRLLELETEKIKSTIGESFSISRTSTLLDSFNKAGVNAFVGESGIGKSVILKQWVAEKKLPTIWIPYSYFRAKSFSDLNVALGIKSDVFELLRYGPGEQVVVIDGIDRITNIEERLLLKSFLSELQKVSVNRHYCIVSSQDQIWKTLVGTLSSKNVVFNVVTAPGLTDTDIDSIAKAVPSISGLIKSPQTREVLKNPKYVDLAAQIFTTPQSGPNRAITEAALVQGFWDLVGKSGSGSQKQKALIGLAVTQADVSEFATAQHTFDTSELPILDELAREGILRIQDNLVRFSHDLYGDWVRQRFLLLEGSNRLKAILLRKDNLYWHRSISLVSHELLETSGFESWKRDVLKFKESGEDLLIDLYLDIAITALNQANILESIKELLLSEGMLARFLERFLVYASTPNPRVMSRREEFGLSELEAAQINRIPLYSYWPYLLQFLAKNIQSITGAKGQLSALAEKWLTSVPYKAPFRKEAALIAYECAKSIFELKQDHRTYVGDELDKKCYRAALAAFPELPSETEDLCLKAIGLREVEVKKPIVATKSAPKSKFLAVTRRRIEKRIWPNGPHFRKDDAFQEVCLTGRNFDYISHLRPELAAQIILAAIIEEPQEWEDIYDDGYRLDDRLGTDYTRDFYPPFYSKGPFLSFFQLAPTQALDSIIKLTDFVTDQWAKQQQKRGDEPFSLEITFGGKTKSYRGDGHVFLWSLNQAHCPDVLVSFLMSLEQWLYSQLEKNEDISKWINHIAEHSNSLALIGVLASVAKQSPKVFLNQLSPLLTQPHLIWWDQQNAIQNTSGWVAMISWSGQGPVATNEARKWFSMPHRKTTLEQWAIYFLMNFSDQRKMFDEARAKWAEELKTSRNTSLEALSCKLDPANYQETQMQDGSKAWSYQPPSDFVEKHKKRFEENDARQIWLMYPYKISKFLDSEVLTEADYKVAVADFKAISSLPFHEEEPFLHNLKDCELALAGLTLACHKGSTALISDKELKLAKEAIQQSLGQLWTNPGIVQFPYDKSEQKYDVLLAKALARYSKGNESDPWTRAQISNLACGPRSAPLEVFVKTASLHGTSESFVLEFLALTFEYAKVRTAWIDVERSVQYSDEPQKRSWIQRLLAKNSQIRTKILKDYSLQDRAQLFSNYVAKLQQGFIDSKTSSGWPKWSFTPESYEFSRNIKSKRFDRNLISLENFTHAVSGLSPIGSWKEGLLEGWIEFSTGGLIGIAERLKKRIGEDGDKSGTPYNQDTWIIKSFATTYFWKSDKALDSALKTFFQCGDKAKYWLDDFGVTFFRLGQREAAQLSNFKTKLESLISIAQSVPEIGKRSWDGDDIWCSFVGMDDITLRFIPADAQDFYKTIFPILERWLKLRSGSDKCLGQFIDLMCNPALKPVRLKGLSLIASSLRGIKYDDYGQERYISTYSQFVSVIWQDHQVDLRESKSSLAEFQEILNGLISVQDPKALELVSQVNSTKLT